MTDLSHSNVAHDPSECGCSPEWRMPKPSGVCASCGGWVTGAYQETPWGRQGLTLTEMWAGKKPSREIDSFTNDDGSVEP